MANWIVDLIVGLVGVILGFVGGFFTKTIVIKHNQKIKGDNNKQQIGEIKIEK